MPRLTQLIPACSLWLALAAIPAFAQSESAEERVFGRVGPERPVVEIPSEQQAGVNPSTPPDGWDVHDPSRVNASQQIPIAAGPVETSDDPALAVTEQPNGPPAPVSTQPNAGADPANASAGSESAPIVPYIAQAEPAPKLLGAPGASTAIGDADAAAAELPWWRQMGQTMAALGIVLALIMVLAFVYTRLSRSSGSLMAPASGGKSPAGLIEVLARYPVAPRQTLTLLKFDRRVLLVTQTNPRSGPVQMNTLCELTDPEDVASVLLKVRDGAGESMNDVFRAAMDRAGGIPASGPAAAGTPAPEFMPQPHAASVAEPKPTFETDYDPEDLRRTVGGSEEERAQLWEDMGTPTTARDPIGALRRKLDSMRGGQPG